MLKLFFKTLRLILTPCMLAWGKLATPKGITRSNASQQQINQACTQLALYSFKACPFCIMVRHEMARLSLQIELRDAQLNLQHREDLLLGGGKIQTPCLQITDTMGKVQWLYESKDIIQHLRQRFA